MSLVQAYVWYPGFLSHRSDGLESLPDSLRDPAAFFHIIYR